MGIVTRRIKGAGRNIDAHCTQLAELVEQRQGYRARPGSKVDQIRDTLLLDTPAQKRDREFHQGFGVGPGLECIGGNPKFDTKKGTLADDTMHGLAIDSPGKYL